MASAANPQGPRTVERYNPAGPTGTDTQLTCPNPSCGDADHLTLIEAANIETPVTLYDVGVTWPEIERIDEEEHIATPVPRRQVVGLRCETCRWAYTGGDALTKATKPEPV